MKRTLLVMSFAATAHPAWADDAGSRHQVFVVWGVGNNVCRQYLESAKQNKAAPYEQWLDGYITARNQTNSKVLDYAGNGRAGLSAWISKYCESRLSTKYYQAADDLLAELVKTCKTTPLK